MTWTPITHAMPPIEQGYALESVDVLAKLDNGDAVRAFYSGVMEQWFNLAGYKLKGQVVAWTTA